MGHHAAQWASCQIRKIALNWCMPGSLNIGFLWSRWRGKRSRHSRRMRNPQFYVSGNRPMSILQTAHKPFLETTASLPWRITGVSNEPISDWLVKNTTIKSLKFIRSSLLHKPVELNGHQNVLSLFVEGYGIHNSEFGTVFTFADCHISHIMHRFNENTIIGLFKSSTLSIYWVISFILIDLHREYRILCTFRDLLHFGYFRFQSLYRFLHGYFMGTAQCGRLQRYKWATTKNIRK